MDGISERRLRYMEFLQRESGVRHHTHEEDSYQYELIKAGDAEGAAAETRRILASGLPGHVSDDPLRNAKYLFVAGATLASRAAISVGLPSERAYNISDLYIQKMDLLASVEQVRELQGEMAAYYAREVKGLEKRTVCSRDVLRAMDFIYEHLHEPLTAERVAEEMGRNRSYFSALFKKETGMGIAEYIRSKRIEAAKNMLRFSEIPYAEIAAILAFSSQSHFSRVFRQAVGITPRAFRQKRSGEPSWGPGNHRTAFCGNNEAERSE